MEYGRLLKFYPCSISYGKLGRQKSNNVPLSGVSGRHWKIHNGSLASTGSQASFCHLLWGKNINMKKDFQFSIFYIRILLWYNKQNIHKYFYNLACGIWYLPWNWPIGTRHSRVPRYKNQKREIFSKTSPGWCRTATTAGMIYTRIGKN